MGSNYFIGSKNTEIPFNFYEQSDSTADNFKDFDAVELYCPKCRQAVPVKKRLLLVLPDGNKYEYQCQFCSESVGIKLDHNKHRMHVVI